jgi:hypothetical protein
MNKRVLTVVKPENPTQAILPFIHMRRPVDLVMRRQLHAHEEFEKLMKDPASVHFEAQSLDRV